MTEYLDLDDLLEIIRLTLGTDAEVGDRTSE